MRWCFFKFVSVVGLNLCLSSACSRSLKQDDCDRLLSRGVGLAAYTMPSAQELNTSIELIRKQAKGEVLQAITTFDQVCVGSVDHGEVSCAKQAKNEAEFVACGGLIKKANETGKLALLAVTKRFSAHECADYGDRGVRIGIVTAEQVHSLIRECEEGLLIGVYRCRLNANRVETWKMCQ